MTLDEIRRRYRAEKSRSVAQRKGDEAKRAKRERHWHAALDYRERNPEASRAEVAAAVGLTDEGLRHLLWDKTGSTLLPKHKETEQ